MMTDHPNRSHPQRRRRARRRRALAAASLALATAASLGLAGCATPSDEGRTKLDFFQFKGEALEDFEEIIADFEAENPDIDVVQNQVADADTLIRTLLVKNRVPDVITLNASGNFGRLAQAGVFHDFTGDPLLETINPAVQEILADLGTFGGDEVNGLGYVNNANGVIYNIDIFEEQGLEVPETFDELIAVCEQLQDAGITPFYGTLADSWTVLPSFNALGAYPAQDDFFDQMREEGENVGPDSAVSFEQDFPEVLDQQAQLFEYAQEGYRGRTYDDGNAAIANGEAAMYMQGIWAVNPIKGINPDVNLGIFPYPTDDPDERLLVSGVDVVVTMGKDAPKSEEAMRFIEYLFQEDVIEDFAASQNMVPSVEGAELSDDPVIQSVAPWFEEGRIAGFIDHQFPQGIPLDATVQQALFTGDTQEALATLDNEWAKVAARTIPVTGE
jgi:raffinose/stachyose/melibiose transport system substrate-binding protein